MKQIAFVSGKGGTGKSTLVSSLSIIAKDKMIADCDVDAPDLHLLLCGMTVKQEDFYGAKEAVIDRSLCNRCGICRSACVFDAIDESIAVDHFRCEGCGACTLVCPEKAIRLESVKTGITTISRTKRGFFSHALLDIGAEGSGRLVTKLRQNAYDYENREKWLLIDGPPGIGCVVISSITNTDAVVIVTEPTLSGLSDLKRVLATAEHFKIPSFVCINKYNLNLEITREIEEFCRGKDIKIIGKIPFDKNIIRALQEYKTPMEIPENDASIEIRRIWERLTEHFNNKKNKETA